MTEKSISALNCDFDIQDLDVLLQDVEKSKKEFDKLKKRNKLYSVLFVISLSLCFIVLLLGHISVDFYFILIPTIFFLMASIDTSYPQTDYPTVREQYKRISAMINKIQELKANPDITDEDLAFVMKFDLDEQIFEVTCFYKNESIPNSCFLIPLDNIYFYEGNKIRTEGKFDDEFYVVNVYLPTEMEKINDER